jgi:outer membrane receptor protein involved in Fe transport
LNGAAWATRGLFGVVVICLGVAGPAFAADAVWSFDLPSQPLNSALIKFAVQTHLSINTAPVARCAKLSRPVIGAYTAAQALARMLQGTGCGFEVLDAHAFAITVNRSRAPAPRAAAVPHPSAPAPAATPLQELVVVATRRLTPADRLAYGVSAVNAATLSQQGLSDDNALALATPAMNITNLGMGRDKIFLRGLSDGPLTGQAQSMVSLYLDDLRLTYNAPDPDLKLIDVSAVEVLRGPQGALYGAGSLGGVIHLVSASPDPSRLSGWASATLGATEDGAGSNAGDLGINLPLDRGRGAIRAVLYREDLGGYINDTALGVKNANGAVRQGERVALSVDLTPQWILSAAFVEQAINAADTQYADAGGPAFSRDNRVREPHDNDFTAYHIALHGDLNWGEVRWSMGLINHALDSRYDASAAPPVPIPTTLAAFDDSQNIQSVVTEATVASPATARLQWLVGAFYAHTQQTSDGTLTALGPSPSVAYQSHRDDLVDEAALYGEATAPLRADLTLTLGGRLFFDQTHVHSLVATPLTGASAAYSGVVSEPGFAPKIVLSYTPSPHLLIYGQAAEGYRAEGINTQGPPNQVFGGPQSREPWRVYQGDELWSLEAGLKLALIDDHLKLRMAGFEAFWKNIQSNQLLASGLPFTANLGDGRNTGLEFEGAYQVGALTLESHFLVNGPELDKANPAFIARADFSLSSIPDLSAGASARYVWPLSAGRLLELDGRWAYVGASQLMLNATTTRNMGDYSTGRLATTLSDARLSWTLAIDNPAGVRANTFAFGNPFSLPSREQATPLRPTTLSATVRIAY